MKKLIFAALFSTTLAASSAFAALLTTTAGDKSIEGIKIAQEGQVNIDGQQLPVSLVGAGLRAKKVVIVNVKVYVAELLSSDASKFVRDDKNDAALNSLDNSRTTALRMTFLRGVDAATVQTSFKEALQANSVNVTDASVAQFLKAVEKGGDAVNGKALTIVTQQNADKTESVYYEDSNGQVTKINGNQGFARQLMSIWLGKSADSGVAALKAQLIKGL
jgi:hypothetical protein